MSLNFSEHGTESLNFSEIWRLIYAVELLIPPLVAKRLGKSESVWYTVTCYANVRADPDRAIRKINPEHYTSLCVPLRCRGLPPQFAIFACPPLGWVDPPSQGVGEPEWRMGVRYCGGKASYWLMRMHPKHQ